MASDAHSRNFLGHPSHPGLSSDVERRAPSQIGTLACWTGDDDGVSNIRSLGKRALTKNFSFTAVDEKKEPAADVRFPTLNKRGLSFLFHPRLRAGNKTNRSRTYCVAINHHMLPLLEVLVLRAQFQLSTAPRESHPGSGSVDRGRISAGGHSVRGRSSPGLGLVPLLLRVRLEPFPHLSEFLCEVRTCRSTWVSYSGC